jgi:hypothetical protein
MNDPMPQMTVSDEERFLCWAHGGSNVFLTGAGGVGKSYLTRIFIQERKAKGLRLAITASTGVAAILVGGSTIHSWAGIDLGPMKEESFEECACRLIDRKYSAARRAEARVRSAQCVLIDEISMLPGRVLSFLDFWFRRLRSDSRPFGGCQMLFVGDFLQLSPVRKDPREPYDWAFKTEAWGCLDKSILLETIRRQTDQTFIKALSAVRVGKLSSPDVRVLRARVRENPSRDTPRLMTHNLAVNKWCELMLSDIEAPAVTFEAETSGSPEAVATLAKNILAPATLVLKVGALVMHLVNKTYTLEDGRELYVVNGALATVLELAPPNEDGRGGGAILRLVDGGHLVGVDRHSYSWSHHRPEHGGPEYSQLPLRLAWALTIHKAQGMTIDRAHIDVRAAREPGQTYVALSRVRTLEGLSLKEWPSGAFVSPQAIRFYQDLKPSRDVVQSADKPARLAAAPVLSDGGLSSPSPQTRATPTGSQGLAQADLLPSRPAYA